MEKAVNLSQLMGIKKFVSDFSALDENYIFAHLTGPDCLQKAMHEPFRVNGMTWFLCREGSMTIDLNLTGYELTPNTLMMTGPESIITVKEVDVANLDAYMLFLSNEFLNDLNIDPNTFRRLQITDKYEHRPVLKIEPREGALVTRYFELIHHNTTANTDETFVKAISKCLIAALLYQVMQFAAKRVDLLEATRPAMGKASKFNRKHRNAYVREFMALLHEHHMRERSVAFYADQMFVTPKYLSLVVKEITGKTAAQWIDELVILEAKNMLRFSEKNVQQVAYALNFPNQSSFGKYFKNLTGQSPSVYQKE